MDKVAMTARRQMTPIQRLQADAETYVGVVIHALGAEYRAIPDVRAARSVSIGVINKILRRSSVEALTPMVLDKMQRRGLVTIEGRAVYFAPALIEQFAIADEPHGSEGT